MKKPLPPSSSVVPKFAPRQREIQPASGGPAGWYATVKEQMTHLWRDVAGLRMAMDRSKEQCVPAAIVGTRIFEPLTNETLTVDTVNANYVVKDSVDYAVPLLNSYPGVFIAHTLKVKLSFASEVASNSTGNGVQVAQVPIIPNHIGSAKYTIVTYGSAPPPRYGVAATRFGEYMPNVMSFFWNLTDEKSLRKFADTLVPDMVLLPSIQPNSGIDMEPDSPEGGEGFPASPQPVDGGNFQFHVPWQIERDGQLTFTFRPINPFFQYSGAAPGGRGLYTNIPSPVTLQVELHGMRVLQDQDARREGAYVP